MTLTAALSTISVLLIEDDDGDALLVEELLEQSSSPVRLVRCRTLAEALGGACEGVDCVLLDLGLPDAVGVDTVARVREAAPRIAVIVLTGLDNEAAGVAAVDAGAQDYLVKGKVDGGLLARAIRYAMGRRQAEDAQQQLRIAAIHADENARLERGLVPRPIVQDRSISLVSSYRPGRRNALLGGDFFDAVEVRDGRIHAIVGDVCGNGPDEAALGASLRIAWRALTLAGAAVDTVLSTLQSVIEHERAIAGTFATVCTLEIEPDRATVLVRRAGHPPPMLIDGTSVTQLPLDNGGPPIGLAADWQWRPSAVRLPTGCSILLYTDGLIEGYVGGGPERLGEEGLRELIAGHVRRDPGWGRRPAALLTELIATATELNGEELSDDVAVLLVGLGSGQPDGA